MRNYFSIAALASLLFCDTVSASSVTQFTPQGEAGRVVQVLARFDTPVVNFGDPRASAPFEVACPAAGSGRWLDARRWVYDFTAEVPSGISCTFTLSTTLRDVAGWPLQGRASYAFSTGAPKLLLRHDLFVIVSDLSLWKAG